MVIGILDDKPYQAMLRLLLPKARASDRHPGQNKSGPPAQDIVKVAQAMVADITVITDVGQALNSP